MTAARIVLAVTVVSTGLFSGLVLYIVGLFQPLLSQLSGAEFTVVMDRFLPAARKNFFNYLFTLTSLLAPVVALFLLRDHTDSAVFWLTLAGWLAFFAGPLLGSRLVAEPLYDVMLGWDAKAPPADWLATQALLPHQRHPHHRLARQPGPVRGRPRPAHPLATATFAFSAARRTPRLGRTVHLARPLIIR
jgi:hypothetical protein